MINSKTGNYLCFKAWPMLALLVGLNHVSAQSTWDAGGGSNKNWSTFTNWSDDLTPAAKAIIFGDVGTAAAGTVTSIVDSDYTIGSLTFNHNSATLQHTLQIATGKTLTQTGAFNLGLSVVGTTRLKVSGDGAWVINAPDGNFVMANTVTTGSTNAMTLDLSELASFQASIKEFNINTGSGQTPSQVSLAKSNIINASIMRVGAAGGNNSSVTGSNFLLGTTNVFNVNTIMIATGRTSVNMNFQSGVTAATLQIRDQAGTGRANLILGSNAPTTVYASVQGGSSSPNAVVNLTGGTIDFLLNELVLGLSQTADLGNGVGYGLSTLTFDKGIIDATNVVLGRMMDTTGAPTSNTPGTNALATHATMNMAGGTLLAGNLMIAQNQDNVTNNTNGEFSRNPNSKGVFNLSGGAATVSGDVVMGSHLATNYGTGYADAAINVTGGTLTVQGNISEGTTGDNRSALTLNGATAVLDMTGGVINVDTFNAQLGTLKNVGEIYDGANNGGQQITSLKKTGSAQTLILEGVNTYTGGTTITAGTLQVGSGGATGNLGSGAVTIGASGTLAFNRSNVYVVDQVLTGGQSTIRQIGSGLTRLTAVSTMTDATAFITDGVLEVTNSNALGSLAEITVGAAGEFRFKTDSSSVQTLAAYGLNLASGSKISFGLGDGITSNRAVSASGTVTVKVFNDASGPSSGVTYNLVQSTNGGLAGATYGLQLYNFTNQVLDTFTQTGNLLAVSFTDVSSPATLYWRGNSALGDAANTWAVSNGTASNWTTLRNGLVYSGVVPGELTDIIFSSNNATATGGVITTTLGVDMRVKSLSMDGLSSSSGSAEIVVNDLYNKLTVVGAGTVSGSTIYVASDVTGVTLNLAVELSATDPLITIGNSGGGAPTGGALTISGQLSGNAFTKRGAGVMTLSGTNANTYIGTTKVEEGTLFLGKTAGVNAISGSALSIGTSTPVTGVNPTVTLNASEQIADNVNVTLYTQGVFDLNGFTETIATLSGTGGSVRNNLSGTTGTLIVGAGDGSSTFSGTVMNGVGTTALTKIGTGTFTLGGKSTHNGLTSILDGRLKYATADALGSGAVTVNGVNAIWDIDSYTDSVGTVTLERGTITGTGTISSSSYQMQSGLAEAKLSGGGILAKRTTGLVILSGNNSYTGQTTIGTDSTADGGILRITSNTALGTTAGNTVIHGNNNAEGRLELANNITIEENFILSARQGTSTDNPAISNLSGNNTITGSIRGQTGGSNYNIESQAGLLTLSGLMDAGNSAAGAGRNFQFMGAGNGNITGEMVNGTAEGLNVYKKGTGTWSYNGSAKAYTGTTNVVAGALMVNVTHAGGGGGNTVASAGNAYNVASGATLGGTGVITTAVNTNINITGKLMIGDVTLASPVASMFALNTSGTGAVVLNNTSTVLFDIVSGAGTGGLVTGGADLLDISGRLTLGTNVGLSISSELSSGWSAGDRWKIIDWADVTRSNSNNFVISAMPNVVTFGLMWDYSDLYSGGTIFLTAVPEPGRIILLIIGACGFLFVRRRNGWI